MLQAGQCIERSKWGALNIENIWTDEYMGLRLGIDLGAKLVAK